MVLECGDPLQAQRVAKLADQGHGDRTSRKQGCENRMVSSEIWNCDGEDGCGIIPKEGEGVPQHGACVVAVCRVPLSK